MTLTDLRQTGSMDPRAESRSVGVAHERPESARGSSNVPLRGAAGTAIFRMITLDNPAATWEEPTPGMSAAMAVPGPFLISRSRISDKKSMKRKRIITIEVDPEAREITVRDEDGVTRPVRSIVVFGGDAEQGILYLFGWGSSADAAWAYKEGFLLANECEDASLRNFYKQCACHIVRCICPRAFLREVGAEDILEEWEGKEPDKGTWH